MAPLQDRAGQRRAVGVAGHDARGCRRGCRTARTTSRRRGTAASPPCSCRRASNSQPSWALSGVRDHVGVGQHHALGAAGGARGVHDEADVVGRRRRRDAATGVAAASSASYSSPSAPSGVTSMTCSTCGSRSRILSIERHQLGADDQHLGAGVVDGVVDLVAGRAPVDDRVGGAQRAGGQRHLDAGRVVLVEERDDVAAADAERLQRAGQPGVPGRSTATRSRSGRGRSSPRRRAWCRPSGRGGRRRSVDQPGRTCQPACHGDSQRHPPFGQTGWLKSS